MEGGDQVVSPADYLQVQGVSFERTGRDRPQRKVFPEFADARLNGGTAVLEAPHARWREFHVGRPGPV